MDKYSVYWGMDAMERFVRIIRGGGEEQGGIDRAALEVKTSVILEI